MKHFCIIILYLSFIPLIAQNSRNRYIEYIERYKDIAIKHQTEFGIPASITLAQGLLESGAGYSELAQKSNNHFGIKCGSSWAGDRVYHDDDDQGECFRKYDTPEQSFTDHAHFLKRKRYEPLFLLDITDYKAWATTIRRCGYATDPSYANKLIQTIETYELYLYDNLESKNNAEKYDAVIVAVMEDMHATHNIKRRLGLYYVTALEGDRLAAIAKETGVPLKKLCKFNDMPRQYPLKDGDVVYLEAKKDRSPGTVEWYDAQEGDSMLSISQRFGITLDDLYTINNLDPDEYIPNMGDRIRVK